MRARELNQRIFKIFNLNLVTYRIEQKIWITKIFTFTYPRKIIEKLFIFEFGNS